MAVTFRVTGPPGTGKTRFLAAEVERRLQEYEPEEIIVTSFTRAAALEIAGRLTLPREQVATLHALAYHALGEPAITEVGKLAREWNKTAPVEWQIVEDGKVDLEEGVSPEPGVGKALDLYNLWRARLLPDSHYLRLACADFIGAWEDYKRQTNSADFADLLSQARTLIPELPNARVFIVDEAQDLTPAQWALLHQWADSADRLILAGDPAQCIYTWGGAEPDELLTPLPAERCRLLPRSFRLPRQVHDYAEGLLERHSPPLTDGRTYQDRGEEGAVEFSPASWGRPEALLESLLTDLAQGKTVMVLATCGYMLVPLLALLRREGVPFHNAYRQRQGAWNPLGAARRGAVSTVDRLLAFLRLDRDTWGADAQMWSPLNFARWAAMLPAAHFRERGQKGIVEQVSSKGEEAAMGAFGEASPEGISRDTLETFLQPRSYSRALVADTAWLAEQALPRYQARLQYGHAIRQRFGGAALRETPRLTVGTIHSVKGGEADIVYLFPDLSYQAWLEAMGSVTAQDAVVRTLYVGCTRARERLVLCRAHDPRTAFSW